MSINKFLKEIDLIDYYITKNITKIIKEKYNFIKKNLFLLSYTNKNKKNSLNILLEKNEYKIIEELINYNYLILDYKNSNQTNLLVSISYIEYFYKIINNLIKTLDIDFLIKIMTNINNENTNFIDVIIDTIASNEYFIKDNLKNKKFKKIVEIIKSIYLLGNCDKILLITKLCKAINNEDILLYIFNYINLDNIDINYDENFLSSIDYLIIKKNINTLCFFINKLNYVYFLNLEDNILFRLLNDYNYLNQEEKILEIFFGILKKSNIDKIKNKFNQNIFYKLLSYYKINVKVIVNYINLFDIYEKDIFGNNILILIKNKYSEEDVNFIILNYKKNKIDIKIKINFNDLLIKTDIGLFNSDLLNNMLYTVNILEKYDNLTIPYFIQNKEYKEKELLLIDLAISNNEKFVISLIKYFLINFNSFLPHIVIWKNKNNYFIDENLLPWLIINKNKKIIYIKLSINILNNDNIRHANIIIIDNKNKIVERFEPYGEINYYNSNDLNDMLINNLAKPLDYEFSFVQPYPGFQTRSDEFNKFNKSYGDPNGYCLAWCFIYLEIKLIIDKEEYNMNAIDIINDYIINSFRNEYKIETNDINLYLIFIRYYGKKLDSDKNKLIKSYNLDPSIYYYSYINENNSNIIIDKINNELYIKLKIKN